jgi:serine phosphatase RsbU (regulator of sigma subunit)
MASASPQDERSALSRTATAPVENATLLVVDDDPDILRVVRFYLAKQNYTVMTAENGQEALAFLAVNPAVELILSDVMMPEMNGLQLLERVRKNPMWSEIPVILISAEGETSKKIAGLNLGADDFITKPFNFDELMARVRNHLRLRRLQREVLTANELLRQQNERFLEDLEAARAVQQAMMPSEFPQSPHYRLAASYLPVERVGGDFFDMVELDGGRKLGVLVADVCGHGIAAAFITAMTKISFRNACFTTSDPAKVLDTMNKALNANIKNGYVTAFYGVLDTERREFAYASGGHPPLLVHRRSENRLFDLQPQSTFLGFFDKVKFSADLLPVLPGDRIVFYTDGLYESRNRNDEYFTTARVAENVRRMGEGTIHEVLDGVLKDLHTFLGERSVSDDVTIVGLDILP